jgi:hypothetical protein
MVARLVAVLAMGVVTPIYAAAQPQTCNFQYTEAFRKEVVDPIVNRLAGARAPDFDTASPTIVADIADPSRRNIRLTIYRPRSIDGADIQIVIEPCSLKVLEAVVDDGGPIAYPTRH